jgi:hypothetical protein
MFVIPVAFAKEHKQMLAHVKELLEYQNGMVAINPRHNKLITSLRTVEGMLADPDRHALYLAINPQSKGDGGAMEVQLPRNLIDSKTTKNTVQVVRKNYVQSKRYNKLIQISL